MGITEDYLTVSKASVLIGKSGAWVRYLLKEGHIVGTKLGKRQWIISKDEVQRYINERGAGYGSGRGKRAGKNVAGL